MDTASGVTLSFTAALFWGLQAALAKKGMETVKALEAGFLSLCIGAATTLTYVTLTGFKAQLGWLNILNLGVAGVLNFALGILVYFQAITISGASKTTAISSIRPLFAALFAYILLNEEMTAWLAVGTTLTILGIYMVSGGGLPKTNAGKELQRNPTVRSTWATRFKGEALALTAALFFGLNPIFVKQGMVGLDEPLIAVLIAMLFGAAAYFPLFILGGGLKRLTRISRRPMVFLASAGLASAGANFSYYNALQLIQVMVVLPISNLYPFIAAVLSALFLKEKVTSAFIIGTALIFVGVYLVIL